MTAILTTYPAPVAYVYEADLHCPECAAKRFGVDEHGTIPEDAIDREGNGVGAVAPWEPWDTHHWPCGTCGVVVIPASREGQAVR